jgi:hypothetical protein
MTYKEALYALSLQKYPHHIIKRAKHLSDCLFSDGSIISQYRCTCGGTGEYVYSLVLS